MLTAFEQGWLQLRNGELLSTAEEGGLNELLTTDRNLWYQQKLSNRAVVIVVIAKG